MLRRTLKIIAFPLAVLAVFGLLYAIWRALDLPPEETIIAIGKSYLDRYGLWVVLVCGIIEALVVIGWYFPGTLVIIVAMIAAVTEPVRYVETAALGGSRTLLRPGDEFLCRQIRLVSATACVRAARAARERQAAADQVRPERDLHHLLAGQSRLVHFDRRRHPAISRAPLRRSGVARADALVRILGDADSSCSGRPRSRSRASA